MERTKDADEDIIDLTVSSPAQAAKYIDLTLGEDDDSATPSSSALNPASTSPAKKNTRKRNKKKPKSGGNSQSNTASATREPSTVPMDRNFILKTSPNDMANNENEDKPSVAQPSAGPESDASHLFYVDVSPESNLLHVDRPLLNSKQVPDQEPEPSTSKLLLPAHVSVFGNDPPLISLSAQRELEEDDYIEYLDYDDHKDTPRYFEEQRKDEAKTARLVCKHCGTEGDHKTSACTILICLTCGARNEHSTRSCPVSKVCFTCGMKGHINATCPNRYTARARDLDRHSECDRCHSTLHQTNECPSWWRLYEYVTEEEKSREVQKDPTLDSNLEKHISGDPWCYNCGSIGHWGDDCDDVPRHYDRPEEASAFSLYNVLSGPFFDPEKESIALPKGSPHRRKRSDDYPGYNDWAKDIPNEVGRQGRKRNMARLEKKAREQEQADDDDWFDRSVGLRIRGEAKRGTAEEHGMRKLSFGKSVVDAGKRLGAQHSQPPALLSRISDEHRSGDSRSRARGHRDRRDDVGDDWRPRRERNRDRQYEYERDRDKHRNMPRFKGGYAR